MIQYQILRTNITRTIWQTVRRNYNGILEVKGLSGHPVLRAKLSVTKFCSLKHFFSPLLNCGSHPLTKSQQPVCIVFHQCWMVTQSRSTQMQQRTDFQAYLIHVHLPKSMLVVFSRVCLYILLMYFINDTSLLWNLS